MQQEVQAPPVKYIRRPAVEEMTGLKSSSIYKMMGEGNFPRSIKITGKAVAWSEAEIVDWLASRPVRGAA